MSKFISFRRLINFHPKFKFSFEICHSTCHKFEIRFPFYFCHSAPTIEVAHLVFLSLCRMGPVGFDHFGPVTLGFWPNQVDQPLCSSLEPKEHHRHPQGHAPPPLESHRAPPICSTERVIRAAPLPLPN
jgi:hypothetical protein